MNYEDKPVDLEVAQQILRYFRRNPNAADTVEGVARWRLLDERIRSNVESVVQAMAWLVSEGLLVSDARRFGPAVFRLNTEEIEKAQAFLEGGKKNTDV